MQLVVGADERGDKRVGRPREHIDGAVELLHLPGLHDGDLVGGDQRFALVVRDIDRGQAQKIVHLADLVAHLLAQMRIEIGQGFVQQEDVGLDHQRPRQRGRCCCPPESSDG